LFKFQRTEAKLLFDPLEPSLDVIKAIRPETVIGLIVSHLSHSQHSPLPTVTHDAQISDHTSMAFAQVRQNAQPVVNSPGIDFSIISIPATIPAARLG
jgi:hypothetical protein